jgi:hypothetical protein
MGLKTGSLSELEAASGSRDTNRLRLQLTPMLAVSTCALMNPLLKTRDVKISPALVLI